VLALSGQVKAQYAGPGGIQEIDQNAFFRPITVFSNTVTDPATAVKLLTRALRYAIIGRGVAQLSIPNDIQREPLEPAYCERETCLPTVAVAPTDEAVRAKGILPDENEWVAGYTGRSGHRMPARSSASRTS